MSRGHCVTGMLLTAKKQLSDMCHVLYRLCCHVLLQHGALALLSIVFIIQIKIAMLRGE
jgi:hypothetical protein